MNIETYWSDYTSAEKDLFQKSCRRLLKSTFIVRDKDEENKKEASPKINIIVSTYYKGTALEGLTKKLEEYLDNAPKNENTINYL